MRTLRKMRLLRKKKGKLLKASLDNKTKLLIGAGGLLLFIVGVNRSFRLDDQDGATADRSEQSDPEPPSSD